ncbi:hypothetical protein NUU61_005602 [Penicillium alfredii]|uniref:Uncharacterized protein n=1 Tax=Penicillium alfredii TaxID=1506179 RepID=A0A9W9F9T0_9EURO|nr:uncharacterized protein NUU61_005602 [Penicillium alfredii]KAJ5096246.1 hypothetical protein NUU61_005602 [Penicillium alfredii]
MRLLLTLLGVLALLAFARADASLPVSTDILYWPVGASQPSVLARVAYDPTSLNSDVVSYHPPKDQAGLVRVGLYIPGSKKWVGSVVSSSSLAGEQLQPIFRLHLGPANQVYHVSLMASSAPVAKDSTTKAQVELVSNEAGVQPHLNRPVVVNPDGQNTEEVPEKGLLQRYWWVLLIIMFLGMSGGGEEQS